MSVSEGRLAVKAICATAIFAQPMMAAARALTVAPFRNEPETFER